MKIFNTITMASIVAVSLASASYAAPSAKAPPAAHATPAAHAVAKPATTRTSTTASHTGAAPKAAPAKSGGLASWFGGGAKTLAPSTSAGGRMVRARLSSGQTVTYNCSLAGNAAKQACKR